MDRARSAFAPHTSGDFYPKHDPFRPRGECQEIPAFRLGKSEEHAVLRPKGTSRVRLVKGRHTHVPLLGKENAKKFQHFDWGRAKNMQFYGQKEPPEYDLSKVVTPTFLYWGKNDWLANPTDVEWLSNRLPASSLIGCYPANFSAWNHLDFLYGKDAKKLVYDKILSMMKLFQK
ncbi:unnamed protein product [Darwinula stevensoni]|uniref:Triacylglycerol lipase n=1 Tax=Darwinula stevensoni TaxID=69355 RepID=A0A7R9FSI1_9CRUS|nr:unnamed protein product [Darwinula stevensoni]CAG0903535.1 unnamed protein product [Darwinula stevensoni]